MEKLLKVTALGLGSIAVSFVVWLLLITSILKQFDVNPPNVVTSLIVMALMCAHYLIHTLTLENGPHEAANTDYFIKSNPRSNHSLDIYEHMLMLLCFAWIDYLFNLIIDGFRKVLAIIQIYRTLRKKMSAVWEEFLWYSGW